jgi:hypothetical protein
MSKGNWQENELKKLFGKAVGVRESISFSDFMTIDFVDSETSIKALRALVSMYPNLVFLQYQTAFRLPFNVTDQTKAGNDEKLILGLWDKFKDSFFKTFQIDLASAEKEKIPEPYASNHNLFVKWIFTEEGKAKCPKTYEMNVARGEIGEAVDSLRNQKKKDIRLN